ncbi:uncharacterized protein LOC127094749 [Lathyrus oleraceus]|uniref:uncharacterized protein LOC127094749 n=1 Tax=Pisum sativum TaxID=3888 RepID=UPI0021CF1B62|nr:uncharacterized protein LOC127094749 [Pisum sativum]
MTDDQKRDCKNHHKARTILLNVISYNEHEKVTNKETAKEILDSLKMTHEAEERLEARLAREEEERAHREAEEKARLEAKEKERREAKENTAAEATAATEAEAKAKVDAEEATHIVAEEAAKEKDVALTQGESSHPEFTPLVLKTLEEV